MTMLVAKHDGNSVYAGDSVRGDEFVCPNCERVVILHRGPIKMPHFQHKSRGECDHGVGETEEHRRIKVRIFQTWSEREIEAALEKFVLGADLSKRFIDVSIMSPNGRHFAIEIVHKNDGLNEIIDKNDWFIRENIVPIWISVIRPDWEDAFATKSQGLTVEKYNPSAFEKWAHGLTYGELYLVSPTGTITCGKFEEYLLVKEETTYFDVEEREEKTNPGGFYPSKKFRNLKILWKRGTRDVRIDLQKRNRLKTKHYVYPHGWVGRLVER